MAKRKELLLAGVGIDAEGRLTLTFQQDTAVEIGDVKKVRDVGADVEEEFEVGDAERTAKVRLIRDAQGRVKRVMATSAEEVPANWHEEK